MTQFSRNNALLLDRPIASTDAPTRLRAADLAQLLKLRITVMVVVTTWLGFAMGEHALTAAGFASVAGGASLLTLVATLVGTALCCMGASALNQVYERDIDARMVRTVNRPLPAGRIAPLPALLMGVALAATGVIVLAAGANVLAAGFAAFTVVSYAAVYTPMKRWTSTSVIVGAAPGALPPVIGYAAAADALGAGAVLMFAIMFCWQLPHFLAIAWLHRDDYARAKLPMLPVLDPTGAATFRQMTLGCVALLPLGLLPAVMGLAGVVYFVGAMLAGLGFLAAGVILMITRTRRHARLMFFASLIYLPVVFALMVIDRV